MGDVGEMGVECGRWWALAALSVEGGLSLCGSRSFVYLVSVAWVEFRLSLVNWAMGLVELMSQGARGRARLRVRDVGEMGVECGRWWALAALSAWKVAEGDGSARG